MYFEHASEIWRDFPELNAGVIFAEGITPDISIGPQVGTFTRIAGERLGAGPESEFPEIQAWRRAFSRMELKPTQYRCASEALLRRFRKEGALPQIHPLIDLCNAISLAFAIPVAVFDVSRIAERIEVRYATGNERYEAFSGDIEHPAPHEVIFVDSAANVHARRWTNRQSGASAVRETTSAVLIVAEAMHASASDDVARLIDALGREISALWGVASTAATLSPVAPRFEFQPDGY